MASRHRVIHGYVHNGRIGVLVELSADTDFATRTSEFQTLAKDLATHVAAAAPASMEALLEQPFVRDPTLSVGQLVASVSNELRERVHVERFVRWDTAGAPERSPEPPKSPAIARRA